MKTSNFFFVFIFIPVRSLIYIYICMYMYIMYSYIVHICEKIIYHSPILCMYMYVCTLQDSEGGYHEYVSPPTQELIKCQNTPATNTLINSCHGQGRRSTNYEILTRGERRGGGGQSQMEKIISNTSVI